MADANNRAPAAPQVSIIVPARNEEAGLAVCLASLCAQQGVSCEIIVVDDHSSDATAAIARSFPGVRVVTADPLPVGWCGKSNACATGARQAAGRWLLFTDADTEHRPGSLARALAEADQHRAALLSYSPEQRVETFWERAVMPNIFAELACQYRPADVCDPALQVAAANGQYLLIARAQYDCVGGHAAVAGAVLEDVELARRVKRDGGRIRFRYGGDAVRTRMYRSFGQMREGWTKNLALLFPHSGSLAARRALEFALIAGSAAGSMVAASKRETGVALAAAAVAATAFGFYLARIRRAHFDAKSDAAALFGLPLFSYLLARSAIQHTLRRPIVWKGRSYRGLSNWEIG